MSDAVDWMLEFNAMDLKLVCAKCVRNSRDRSLTILTHASNFFPLVVNSTLIDLPVLLAVAFGTTQRHCCYELVV